MADAVIVLAGLGVAWLVLALDARDEARRRARLDRAIRELEEMRERNWPDVEP